jgi:uncharacterized protein (DUF1697 family)
MFTKYVALLRGINLGPNNRISMPALTTLFTEAYCWDVESYIQSGNVVFTADLKKAAKIPAAICTQIECQYGFKTHITLRTLPDLQQAWAANPYPDRDKTYIGFLANVPTAERIARLDPNRSPPDQFTVSGREIFLYLPKGLANSKLTNAYFDSKLKTVITMRNWRTLQKLLAMMTG